MRLIFGFFELTDMKFLLEKDDDGDCSYQCLCNGVLSDGVIPREFFELMSFGVYDTNERIMPLSVETMRINLEKYNTQKINRRIDDACDLILKKYSFRSYKEVERFTVNDFLRREGIPKLLAADVF